MTALASADPGRTLWLDEIKYSERGRCISWSASSLIAALSEERRKETKPSRSIMPVAGSAYLTNRRRREASSSVLCRGAFVLGVVGMSYIHVHDSLFALCA